MQMILIVDIFHFLITLPYSYKEYCGFTIQYVYESLLTWLLIEVCKTSTNKIINRMHEVIQSHLSEKSVGNRSSLRILQVFSRKCKTWTALANWEFKFRRCMHNRDLRDKTLLDLPKVNSAIGQSTFKYSAWCKRLELFTIKH